MNTSEQLCMAVLSTVKGLSVQGLHCCQFLHLKDVMKFNGLDKQVQKLTSKSRLFLGVANVGSRAILPG